VALERLLIAIRGEIAVRVNRAARALGMEVVQVVSAADRDSLAAELRQYRQTVNVGPPAVPAAHDGTDDLTVSFGDQE